MGDYNVIGRSIQRKDAERKVTGAAGYTDDFDKPGLLYARMLISPYAHARIKAIDCSRALKASGVRAVLTGAYYPHLTGELIIDRPPIAIGKVRYHGEPVAVVVADSDAEAQAAVYLIKAEYELLPVVNSPGEGIKRDAPLVHERLGEYKVLGGAYPEAGTNIANRTKIRKGDAEKGFRDSDVIAEASVFIPPSDHAAMETRSAIAEIQPDGNVIITACSQSPFIIKDQISRFFRLAPGKVIVNVPFVGGAYGGKTSVQLEFIALLCSGAVGGRAVKLTNLREEDLITSPDHIGLEAKVRLGAKQNGLLTAAEITLLFDGGAYSDRAAAISQSAGLDCTGPYNIENLWCDSICVYTNHPYATAFRGFGHPEQAFAVERAMDILADKLLMDPMELRIRNAILPGHTSATQTILNRSNVGDLPKCIKRVAELIDWNDGIIEDCEDGKVRAKGVSCFWKNSGGIQNTEAGVIITFNPDGSVNLICGVVEMGQGTKTGLAQILAEKMRIDVEKVHVIMQVNTQTDPYTWRTVASKSLFLAGNAVLRAAEDAIRQLFRMASIVLRTLPDELDMRNGRIFLKSDPGTGIDIKDIALGYTYPNGNAIQGQVIGRGSYVMEHLTNIDKETGKGNPGPEWTVGAGAVEVEYDKRDHSYKLLRAACVIDAGTVINFKLAEGQLTGGMNTGLSFASKEAFLFNKKGIVQNIQLRTYRTFRYGENAQYLADFVQTAEADAPYGARGVGEYGTVAMPAALANSLSRAARVPLNKLPLIPEYIWRVKRGEDHDSV